MPYYSNGTLKTDIREVAISETWDTQTEWEAYQSANNVAITNGVVMLAEQTQPDSGISHWTYDDADLSSGLPLDQWGNNDAVSNSGATTGVTGANQTYTTNEAFSYDDVDDIVDYGSPVLPLDSTQPFSIAFWVLLDNHQPGTIVGQQHNNSTASFGGTMVNMNGSSQIRLMIRDTSSRAVNINVAPPSTGVWTLIVATYDGSKDPSGMTIYYDDANAQTVQESTNGTPDNSLDAPNFSTGGRDPSDPGNFFGGDIDDVRLYSKELTSTEVSRLYNNGSIL